MSETYESRRKRWLQLQETLPDGLRARIPLRNVQDTARLSLNAQRTLAQALDEGLKQIPTALRTLKRKPSAMVAELLSADHRKGMGCAVDQKLPTHVGPPVPTPTPQVDERDVLALAELFRSISPGANAISAEFWAKEKPMLLAMVGAHRAFLEANASEVDFVVFCAFLLQMFKDADRRLAEQPSYRNALSLSNLVWPTQSK